MREHEQPLQSFPQNTDYTFFHMNFNLSLNTENKYITDNNFIKTFSQTQL